jgi:integrase
MARLPDFVTRIDTGAGVRYEARAHACRADGSRFQHKRRFKTPTEATAWYSKVTSELAQGTHTAPSDLTSSRRASGGWKRSPRA